MSRSLARPLVLWAALVGAPDVGHTQQTAIEVTGEIAGRVVRPGASLEVGMPSSAGPLDLLLSGPSAR